VTYRDNAPAPSTPQPPWWLYPWCVWLLLVEMWTYWSARAVALAAEACPTLPGGDDR
jgi:hypothetical protein